jgi:hypothetical protein
METPPSLQRIIDKAQNLGEYSTYIDRIYGPFFTSLIRKSYPEAKLVIHQTRTESPMHRVTLTFKKHGKK